MKLSSGIFVIVLMALFACNSVKNQSGDDKNNENVELTEFEVTELKDEKDGQTVFMTGERGGRYTMVISPANGNWVELEVGNRVAVEVESIMESDPARVIANRVTVVEDAPPFGIEYEKTEEEVFWVNARKTEGAGMWGQLVECLEIQTGAELDKDGVWEMLCDEIEYFDYREGYFYQIKVLKKWLKDHELLADRAPYDLELITVVTKEKDPSYVNPVKISIATDKAAYSVEEPVMLTFKIENTGEKPFTFLPWQTPLEETFTGDFMEVLLNGKLVPYTGIMVKRMPPTDADYVTLDKGESQMATIDLRGGYTLSETGMYTIQFKETYGGLPESNTVEFEVK